ncbi:unnamed protein product [Rotaria sp. Silwood2]|nr:unnamed protein product [Rotaria sp. Silwood2]CAF4312388.1 unnamed protein product [Rotaria sp. Silwood2]CAF4691142.1 unnamed protein product [Rotaria sp. Silwood2]
MEPHPYQNLLNTTALKELPKFTGDPNQKVTQFLNAVEHIGSFAGLNESMLHSIAIIKLGGSAFSWYDNNKEHLQSWRDLKQHLLERFKPSLSATKMRLKERKQQPGESLNTYYDDIIDLCKQVDQNMPLHMIVDYLQDGIRNDLKIHVKRRLKTLNDEPTPATFWKIAHDEEELLNEIPSESQQSIVPPHPYFASVTAVTHRQPKSSENSLHSHIPQNTHSTDYMHILNKPRTTHPRSMQPNQFYPCLICQRSNHRTIDCYHKQPRGCYKCGNYNHNVRACPQVFQ